MKNALKIIYFLLQLFINRILCVHKKKTFDCSRYDSSVVPFDNTIENNQSILHRSVN